MRARQSGGTGQRKGKPLGKAAALGKPAHAHVSRPVSQRSMRLRARLPLSREQVKRTQAAQARGSEEDGFQHGSLGGNLLGKGLSDKASDSTCMSL